MQKCDNCGNAYERNFKVVHDSKEYNFDCFECAIHMLAPSCKACGTRVIGHGHEDGLDIFCCASCARMHGITALKDHVEQPNITI